MVCAVARSGSNLFTDGLHATRRAGRPKQFFLPKFEGEYGAKQGLDSTADFGAYVKGIVASSSTCNEVFGFKVMAWYLEEFIDRLKKARIFGGSDASECTVLQTAFPRLRLVQIVRRNKLRQAISKAKAIQSGLWKVQKGNAAIREPVFDEELITRCLEETLKDEQIWQNFFERNDLRPHLVEYETLVQDFEGVIRGVLDFLRIRLPREATIAPPSTVPQTDAISRDWEERYSALHPHASELEPRNLKAGGAVRDRIDGISGR